MLAALLPIPVYAAPAVTSITPSSIVNDVANVITVAGTEFNETAAVLMDGSALVTNYLNTQTLTAAIPAGVTAGDHQITVTMDSGLVDGSATLTILAPTPIPPPIADDCTVAFVRPQFILESSKVNGTVSTNSQFKLTVKIGNAGTADAYSTQVVFASTDLVPLKAGGIAVVGSVPAGSSDNIDQQFLVTGATYGVSIIPLDVTVTYYDGAGTSYSDKFTLSIPTTGGSGSGTVYATATPTGVKSSARHHELCCQRGSAPAGRDLYSDDDRSEHGQCQGATNHHDRRRRFKRNEWRRDTGARRRIGRKR